MKCKILNSFVIITTLLMQAFTVIGVAPAQAASAWQQVGTAGFSAGTASFPSLALDSSGTPYVAYMDGNNNDKASVMKYNGSNWEQVGTAGFSAGMAYNPSLAVDSSGTPYVAYMDIANDYKLSVMKYNGSSWEYVGGAGFSAGWSGNPSLKFDSSDTLYVAFRDGAVYGASVMKYNGSSWEYVGAAGFSAGEAYFTILALDNSGTPYVANVDNLNGWKASVMKYNGSSWEYVGGAGFSAGGAYYTSLAIDSSGAPYIAYEDLANSNKASVMKYNGSSWEQVGTAGFSAGQADSTFLALDSNDTPYVAYTDGNTSVMKYNGSSWEQVGTAGFSVGGSPSLALDSSGAPYIVYTDDLTGYKASVMKFADTTPPTVTFHGNGNDGGSMSPQSSNFSTNLTANAFTRNGYNFAGWDTSSAGTAVVYADGATYAFSADTDLYAVWQAADITTGMLAWYKFDGDATDSSGNGYHGVPTGITYTAGAINQAAQFYDNAASKVEVPSLAGNLPGSNSPRSVAFWAYQTDHNFSNAVSWGYGTGDACDTHTRFSVNGVGNGKLALIGECYDFYSSSNIQPQSTWVHVVVTYDSSNLRFYTNGVLQQTFSAPSFNTDASQMLRIGINVVDRTDEFWGGLLDEVRIYGRALSAADVIKLYDVTPPTVVSAVRASANPTNAASVDYTVTFSESVTGVDASDFYFPLTTVSGASVTNVTGSGTTYTVTVNTGSGSGVLYMAVGDDDSILDTAGNPLGGVGLNNGKFLGQKYTVDKTFPTVSSLVRASANPTTAATVQYTLIFSEPVNGVDASDFAVVPTGLAGSSVASVSGAGTTYTVTVNTGLGNGTLGLNLSDNNSIKDVVGNELGGTAAGDGDYTGEVYDVNVVDATFPTVISSMRASGEFTYATSVDFTVTFSKSVTGVDMADFGMANSATIIGASITNVTGSGTTYTVTVNTGTGNGTIRLTVKDNDTIKDGANNPLGGIGLNNGKFTTGQWYSIYKTTPSVVSLVRASADPTNAATVQYTLTFSEPVRNLNATDFSFTYTGGTTGASVVSVTGLGTGYAKTYTITVNTGTGNGTLRLDVMDSDTITSLSGILLGGPGVSVYPGEVYTISKP